jgi:hypothetical protein
MACRRAARPAAQQEVTRDNYVTIKSRHTADAAKLSISAGRPCPPAPDELDFEEILTTMGVQRTSTNWVLKNFDHGFHDQHG